MSKAPASDNAVTAACRVHRGGVDPPALHAGVTARWYLQFVPRWFRQLRVRIALLLAGCSLLVLLVLFALVVPPLQQSLQNARQKRLATAVHASLPVTAAALTSIGGTEYLFAIGVQNDAGGRIWTKPELHQRRHQA